jgi:hypothetical protein
MRSEQDEARAADISELLGRILKERLTRNEEGNVVATAAEMKLALDYVKHHGVTDPLNKPDATPLQVSKAAEEARLPPPFDSVQQEID